VDRDCIEQAEISGTVKHGKSLAWVVSFFMIVEIFLYSLSPLIIGLSGGLGANKV
jgi:hypothetical protein